MHPSVDAKGQLEYLRQRLQRHRTPAIQSPSPPAFQDARELSGSTDLGQLCFVSLGIVLDGQRHGLTFHLRELFEIRFWVQGKLHVLGGKVKEARSRIPGSPCLYGFLAWVRCGFGGFENVAFTEEVEAFEDRGLGKLVQERADFLETPPHPAEMKDGTGERIGADSGLQRVILEKQLVVLPIKHQ